MMNRKDLEASRRDIIYHHSTIYSARDLEVIQIDDKRKKIEEILVARHIEKG
jgi:hypothetical protein